ncbi:MAG TPA: hypothetical protein VGQ57_15285 [Polyangiaceae bacterium]|nr:hypothetical protein [Polyangiaceae bacterium]
MAHICEICTNCRPGAVPGAAREAAAVTFGARTVLLCRGHARIAANAKIKTFAALRDLYGSGRRSFVPRRRPDSSDAFRPARSAGRRASDR